MKAVYKGLYVNYLHLEDLGKAKKRIFGPNLTESLSRENAIWLPRNNHTKVQ